MTFTPNICLRLWKEFVHLCLKQGCTICKFTYLNPYCIPSITLPNHSHNLTRLVQSLLPTISAINNMIMILLCMPSSKYDETDGVLVLHRLSLKSGLCCTNTVNKSQHA